MNREPRMLESQMSRVQICSLGEKTIESLTVGGCSKTPPSRSVSELRHHDRTEHLLQGSTGILWDRKTLMAYMDRAKELMTSSRCSLTDSLSVNVMPSILSEWTRSMPASQAAVQHDVASGCLGKRSRPTSMHSTSDCWPLPMHQCWQFLCIDCLHYRHSFPVTSTKR